MHGRTILLASDLSARSDRPTDRALLLRDQLSASVVLLHVVEDGEEPETVQARAREALHSFAGPESDGMEVEVRRGAVDAEILRLAEERSALLIITGVARFNELRDYFLGTAVDHLVRQSPVPVLVVKARAIEPYRRLLVATDFSDNSKQALEAAVRLFPEAAITVWHNCHATYEAWLDKEETAIELKREAEEEMARFLAAADIPENMRPRLESAIGAGQLHKSAAETLREGGFNLLIVGTHGRGGFGHATIGSRAAELLQVVECDTLMVRGKRD